MSYGHVYTTVRTGGWVGGWKYS